LVVIVSLKVARRSGTLARHVWRLTALAYAVWGLGQALATYGNAFPSGSTEWLVNLLFSFWFVPIGMALFLGPDSEPGEFDWLVGIDCVQAILFWVVAYVYFFVIPSHYNETMGMAPSVLALYFAYYGVLTAAFLLRALLSGPGVARALFGRMGLLLLLSGLVDAYYSYGPGKNLAAGAWFDLLWSIMLVIPFSFTCFSVRTLIIQHQLLQTQEALRHEATHDGLTNIWNRITILDILHRELLRAERERAPVGIIMADVDHFKLVNDNFGHASGDIVLRMVASEIAAALRPYDSVG